MAWALLSAPDGRKRPEIFVFCFVEFVELHSGIGGVHLQVKRCSLYVKSNSATGQQMVALTLQLQSYNSGLLANGSRLILLQS